MPYESPNIVIVPTMSSVNKKEHLRLPNTSTSDTANSVTCANVLRPSPNMPKKVTHTPQEAWTPSNGPQSEINVSKQNVTVNQGNISVPEVSQSNPENKNSASSESFKKAQSQQVSSASNYLQSIRQNTNAAPIKADLLSTSNDIKKQAVNNTNTIKTGPEIKINLLSRSNVAKNIPMKVRPPLLPTPTFNSGVRPMYPTWSYQTQLKTPENQRIHYRDHIDTTLTCPCQFQAPINQSNQCKPRMDTTLTCPPLLQEPTALSLDSRRCMGTICTSSSMIQSSANLSINSKSCKDTTWNNPPLTGPLRLQTHNLRNDSRPYSPLLLPSPNPLTGYRPQLDTNTSLAQKLNTNTMVQPQEYMVSNNPIITLDREQETAYTKTTFRESLSSNVKPLMDYTWLTRAHYANINQPNNNSNMVKPVGQSQITEKCVEGKPTNSLGKEVVKPSSVIDRENNNNKAESKQNSSKELLNSETNAKKLGSVRKSIGLKTTNKEKHEKKKNFIKKAIQTLETKIKKHTSKEKPYKIPKHSDSKNDNVKPKETNSKTQPKKTTPDKSKKTEKQIPKKRTHSPELTYKKRVRPNIENNKQSILKIGKLRHIDSSESDQRLIREDKSSQPKSKKEIHTNEQKEKKSSGLQCILVDKNRSKRVEAHSSEKLEKKRERRDSSYETSSKKQFPRELGNNTKGNKETSLITSVVTPKKSAKHPRIEAPDSDDSDANYESDFDLRSKLSRGSHKRYKRSHEAQTNDNDKIETTRENFAITVIRNYDDQTATSSKPGPSIPKKKSKKYKKIRLVINVIQEDTSGDSSSDDSKNTAVTSADVTNESFAKRNVDLSFLDDFNIDEIVNSLRQNPKLDNIHQNTKQKIENTKTSTESVTRTFVRPIIIKKEIKLEQVDPEIQSNVTYSQESTPNYVTDLQSLKNIYEQSSENVKDINVLTNPVLIENIKQEKHDDQTVKENSDNANSDKAYLETLLEEDILQTVNQLINIVVKNTPSFIDTPSVVELVPVIKHEPCEDYSNNDCTSENEPQELNIADKINYIENTDKQESTDLIEKQSKSTESYNSCEFTASEKIFDGTKQCKVQVIEEVIAENNNNVISSEIINTLLLNENVNLTEKQHPELEEIASEDKPSTTTLVTSAVTTEEVYEVNSSKVVRSIKLQKDGHVTETIQPKVLEKTYENKFPSKTLVTSNVTITIEENDEVKICSKEAKTKKLKKGEVVHVTVTKQPEVENEIETNTLVISDISIVTETNYPEVGDKLGTTTSAISNVTTVSETNHPEVGDKLGTSTTAISAVTTVSETNYPEVGNKLGTNTSAISDVTTVSETNHQEVVDKFGTNTSSIFDATTVSETNQPEVGDKFGTNTSAISNVSILTETNHPEVGHKLRNNTSAISDVSIVTQTNHPEVGHKLGTNTSAISDFSIVTETNHLEVGDKPATNTSAISDVSIVTQTNHPEVGHELGTNASAISDVAIEESYEVKIRSEVVNATETIKPQFQEKSPEDETTNNAPAKSDVTTGDKNNELTENKKLSNNEGVDTRSFTIMHPSFIHKSDKILAGKIEEKIFNYLNIKLNVQSLIRHGKFAKVFRFKDTNGQNYALKILNNEHDFQRLGYRKEKMLKELQNDIPKENLNVTYLIEGFGLDRKWCFLMDYYPLNLAQALRRKRFDMDAVQELAKQLVAAVLLMRSNNIVHSDIKPGHILLDLSYKNLKVCGFDAAYYADENIDLLPNIGTMHYRAPEIILGYSAGFNIDVWATALIMYEMAAGSKLFDSQENYNNNVLFNQLSLCGPMPMDMVQNSRFAFKHFVGSVFKRTVGPRGQYILFNMHEFNEKHKMYDVLMSVCNQNWSFRSKARQAKDRLKLLEMSRLLDKMLVLDPRRRLPIEFVYADSFFM